MHALNNSLIGTLTQRPALAAWLGMDAASGAVPWGAVVAGTLVMGVALAVLAVARPVTNDSSAPWQPLDPGPAPVRTSEGA